MALRGLQLINKKLCHYPCSTTLALRPSLMRICIGQQSEWLK